MAIKATALTSGQSVLQRMRYYVLILCLVPFQVQASDWFSRTVRVDLIVNGSGRVYDPQYDSLELSTELLSGVDATNGQYPWNIFTTASIDLGFGSRVGQLCLSTIISDKFFLTDYFCVGHHLPPPGVSSIEELYGFVQLNLREEPTNFVRHYWYIEPSCENSPALVLARFHKTLTFNPNVQPIRLPSPDNFSYEGWSSYLLRSPTRLRSTNTSILTNSLCDFQDAKMDDYEICATDGSEGFQISSSDGAWIVYEYDGFAFIPVLIGIGRNMNPITRFVAASRVTHFMEWIEKIQRDN